jgi:tetratricopeptide (TPR) repeat protein
MRRLIATIALIAGTWSAGLAREPVKDFGVAVRKFSAERHKLARHLSSRLDLPLPEQAEAFFRAAETGPWESVSNRMYAEAEEAFEQAIRLCPGSPEASYRLADTQARQGQTERAVGTMRNFLRHAPPDQRDGALKYIRQLEERMREKK